MNLASLKNCLPSPVKRAARTAWQRQQLRRALQRLLATPPGVAPDRPLLAALRAAWDNDGFTADVDFLVEVVRRAAVTPGPVLECGSGLTTLLLGAVAGRRGVEFWALEHEPQWRLRVAAELRRHGLRDVRLWYSPLRDYGDFVWYTPPLALMPEEFRLVVCDGPPEGTRGGRVGLLPVMGVRLSAGAVILLDDAARESERDTVRRWQSAMPLEVESRRLAGGTMAQITRC